MTILSKTRGNLGDGINLIETQAKIVKFRVRGNPVPLARHRSYKGLMFNPSSKKQKQFCRVVLEMLPEFCFGKRNQSVEMLEMTENSECLEGRSIDNVIPIFQNQVISVQIISRMKRPKKHFIGNKPGPGRLRGENSMNEYGLVKGPATHLQVTRTDVDNLAKFVLDSLNGVLYEDDRQVASLHVIKVYDHEEPYSGSTDVTIQTMTDEDFCGLGY
jgi:Holliday junction resolvase RusA-like endonuclease